MKVMYNGPLAGGVELAGTGDIVPLGGIVEVDDDYGVTLCDQPDNWVPGDEASLRYFVKFCEWVAALPTSEQSTGDHAVPGEDPAARKAREDWAAHVRARLGRAAAHVEAERTAATADDEPPAQPESASPAARPRSRRVTATTTEVQ